MPVGVVVDDELVLVVDVAAAAVGAIVLRDVLFLVADCAYFPCGGVVYGDIGYDCYLLDTFACLLRALSAETILSTRLTKVKSYRFERLHTVHVLGGVVTFFLLVVIDTNSITVDCFLLLTFLYRLVTRIEEFDWVLVQQSWLET